MSNWPSYMRDAVKTCKDCGHSWAAGPDECARCEKKVAETPPPGSLPEAQMRKLVEQVKDEADFNFAYTEQGAINRMEYGRENAEW